MTAKEFLPRVQGARPSGNGWTAKCPAHEDSCASLSLADGDKGLLLKCHAGCSIDHICNSVGLRTCDLFNGKGKAYTEWDPPGLPPNSASYNYIDEDGNLVIQARRYQLGDGKKTFRQCRPNGKGGWIWNVEGVRLIPFHLPELIKAVHEQMPVYVVEGEKDVLAIEARGFAATCNPMGAGKWKPEYNQFFKEADVKVIADKDKAGREHAAEVAKQLSGIAGRVVVVEVPDVNGKFCKDASDYFEAGGGMAELDELEPAKPKTLLDRINERRFTRAKKPPEPVTRYSINGIPIATDGNIGCVHSAPKAGKSAVIGAMMASTMSSGCDCLGYESENPQGHAVIHIDTEQSLYDHWLSDDRALRRAKLQSEPPWLCSHCLTGFNVADLRAAVPLLMREALQAHGGIHSVLIDGGADLVSDVNDPEETAAFVAELHALAIQYNTTIIVVIHLNPNSDNKTRGHLGSQLERKAETNIKLEKDGEVIQLWSEKNRRAPIPRAKGPVFAWSDVHQMHVSVSPESKTAKANIKTKLDLLAHVPTEGAIDKTVLLNRGNESGIAQKKCTAFLDELIGDKSVFLWLTRRSKTNPLQQISRHPQPEPQPVQQETLAVAEVSLPKS